MFLEMLFCIHPELKLFLSTAAFGSMLLYSEKEQLPLSARNTNKAPEVAGACSCLYSCFSPAVVSGRGEINVGK